MVSIPTVKLTLMVCLRLWALSPVILVFYALKGLLQTFRYFYQPTREKNMKLDKFEFIYNKGSEDEWRIENCQLGQINLIVGKNASGKSRIVRGIYTTSKLLTENVSFKPDSSKREWHLYFDLKHPNEKTEYVLKLDNGLFISEKLIIGDQTFLERGESGEGNIWAEELKQSIRFQTSLTRLAVVNRRDTIQHPFLESIYQWANTLRFYEFGTSLGQKTSTMILPTQESIENLKSMKNQTNFKDYNSVVEIFVIGKGEIGNDFIAEIIKDMKKIGYNISDIGTKVPSAFSFSDSPNPNNLPQYLYVKEDDLNTPTEQAYISQGMFRVLSLLIQINYSLLAHKPSCIIIDDIGEGLDYQRSSAMIKLLIEKAQTGLIQIIMTTNDEFIMNGVPLEYWSVIERKSGSAKLHNIFNAREKFEQFEFIGLNNFDFFTSEFALQELDEEE
jgi:AAA15 family ATPase/GTPase